MDELPYDQDTQLALRLLVALARCTHSVMRYTIDDMVGHGLKISEFEVLDALYHKGPLPQGAIADRALLTMGSITHVVDQLEKKGLVRRVPCPEDRRIIHAEITVAGKEKMDAIFPPHARVVKHAVSGLSLEEQQQALALLKKMGLFASALPRKSGQEKEQAKMTKAALKNKVGLP